MGLYREGVQLAKEALQISEQLSDTVGQGWYSNTLTLSLYDYHQLDVAEKAASRAINLLLEGDEQFPICQCHCFLGNIYHSKGDIEKASNHFKVALRIASSFDWNYQLFWIHHSMVQLVFDQGIFSHAHNHVEHAKSHVVNDMYYLGHAMELQARFWYTQHRLGEAKSETLHAVEVYQKLGATRELERCRQLLGEIDSE